MTFTWWLVPVVVLGILLVLAIPIGAIWAQRDMPMPEDRPSETWRSVRAMYWCWLRGRRSP
jgi:hypothetical protein